MIFILNVYFLKTGKIVIFFLFFGQILSILIFQYRFSSKSTNDRVTIIVDCNFHRIFFFNFNIMTKTKK